MTWIPVLCSLLFWHCNGLGGALSVTTSPEELNRTWLLADVLKGDTEELGDGGSMVVEALRKHIIADGLGIALFPDGRAGEFFGSKYRASTWKILPDNSGLLMTEGNKTDTVRFVSKKMGSNDQKLHLTMRYKSFGTCEFVENGMPLEDFNNDPWYPDNNRWRKAPESSETELQIRQRLANFVKHNACILKAADERDSKVVSFEQSKGIIQIYNGGIGAVTPERIPKEWFTCFFNKEEAMKAYEIYVGYMTNLSYRGAATGNWIIDDYNLLLMLYGTMVKDIQGES